MYIYIYCHVHFCNNYMVQFCIILVKNCMFYKKTQTIKPGYQISTMYYIPFISTHDKN